MGFVSRYHNKYQTGGLQHLLARQIKEEVGAEVFDSYFKFTFVRNPWDKVVSQYAFMAQRPDLRELIGMTEDTPFADYLNRIERQPHVQWQPQVDFLRDHQGRFMVDFVGRFEALERDAQVVFERLGLPCRRLPHKNASRRRNYAEYFGETTSNWIRRFYAEDIAAFDYEFEAGGAQHDPPASSRYPVTG